MAPAVDAAGRPDAPRVALVGCGARKLPHRAQALQLYTGTLFRKAVDFALATHDEVFALSAKHGLVGLEDELEPYDATLHDLTPGEYSAWGKRVVEALVERMGGVPCAVTVLAGAMYADAIRSGLRRPGWPVAKYPLTGLGIGERMAWLTAALQDAGGLPC